MALDFKIGASAYEKLPADVQKEYKKTGDDYQLDLNGYEDPTALKNARDAEKTKAQEAARDRDKYMRERDALQAKVTDFEKNGGSVDDKVAAKEREWKEKYDKDIGEKDQTINKMRDSIVKAKRTEIAGGIASKISTAPKLLQPEIAGKLHIELNDDFEPVVKVLGSDGKPSASSLEDLEKSILTNKEYASVLIQSKASGGGSAPRVPPSGGSATRGVPSQQGTGDKPQSLATMDPKALAAVIRERKEAAAGSA